MNRHIIVPALVILLGSTFPIRGQSPNPPDPSDRVVSYAFVSPSIKEVSLPSAIKKLNSREEISFIETGRLIGCRVRLEMHISKAIGSWGDGAENSTVLRMTVDEPTLRYIVSLLGKTNHQKTVLYFRPGFGTAKLYILFPAKSFRSPWMISNILDKTGMAYRTLVPLRHTTLIYIVDLNDELADEIQRAARGLRARIKSLRGSGNFIGNDADREKAQQIFQFEISNYEVAHPRLSRHCSAKSEVGQRRIGIKHDSH